MWWRTLGRVAATVVVGLVVAVVVAVVVAAVGIAGAREEVYTPRGPGAPSAPVDEVAAPTHDPGKPTAVIVLGPEGANAADALAPYEVLATTGAFNLYTVAPQRRPVPLTGGLDLVPDLSLGQLDQRLPAGPEVIVVPQLSEVASGLPPSVARSSSGSSGNAPTVIRCWSGCAWAPRCRPRPACWMAGPRPRTGWA
jgi:hypothetical protein